jgi:hypothetical protein
MGKRSSFERNPRDFYKTPRAAIVPLVPHLPTELTTYHEPCAGDGALVHGLNALAPQMHCMYASDIEPQEGWIVRHNALDLTACVGTMFITNPPWDRSILHPLIMHLSDIAPTWLLIDADWAHTGQSAPFLKRCSHIVSIGRVKWIEGSTMIGKDNAAWYCFSGDHTGTTMFVGR